MWIMAACCVIGMGGVLAVLVFGVPVNNVLFGLMLLICPLSHVLMMGLMGKDHAHGQSAPAEKNAVLPSGSNEHCASEPAHQ
jgi:hypothetical protein